MFAKHMQYYGLHYSVSFDYFTVHQPDTTGKSGFADCQSLSRLPFSRQSAKGLFADCFSLAVGKEPGSRQSLSKAVGKGWQSVKRSLPTAKDSRQRQTVGKSGRTGRNSGPSALPTALR